MKYNISAMKQFIIDQTEIQASIAVVLGSGMGGFCDQMDDVILIPYKNIPNYPKSTVRGHAGELAIGSLHNIPLLAAKGRFHYYEGYDIQTITLPVKLFHSLGIKSLIITNAAGSLKPDLRPGSLMIIDSHIDCTFRASVTEPEEYSGTSFHDPVYIELAVKSADQINLSITKGTYCWTLGPSYETPAEVSYIRSLGGDAVGMSTVPEIQAAAELGMKVLGISTITNYAAGIIGEPLSHDDVIKVSAQVEDDFTNFLTEIIKGMVL